MPARLYQLSAPPIKTQVIRKKANEQVKQRCKGGLDGQICTRCAAGSGSMQPPPNTHDMAATQTGQFPVIGMKNKLQIKNNTMQTTGEKSKAEEDKLLNEASCMTADQSAFWYKHANTIAL